MQVARIRVIHLPLRASGPQKTVARIRQKRSSPWAHPSLNRALRAFAKAAAIFAAAFAAHGARLQPGHAARPYCEAQKQQYKWTSGHDFGLG